MILLRGIMRALEPPLRFFLACFMSLVAALLGSLVILPEAGYPWPGRLVYQLPGLECLLLGFLLVGGLAASRCLPRPGSLPGVLVLVLLGFAGGGLTQGLVPGQGIPRVLSLVVVAVLVLRWRPGKPREDVVREAGLLTFVLVLMKYVLLEGLASEGAAGLTGLALRSVALGSLTQTPLPAGDEYRVFAVLLLFAGAVGTRWEPLPEAPAISIPGGPTLPGPGPGQALLGDGAPGEEVDPLPEPVPALPARTGPSEPTGSIDPTDPAEPTASPGPSEPTGPKGPDGDGGDTAGGGGEKGEQGEPEGSAALRRSRGPSGPGET